MKIYLCWLFKQNGSRIVVGAFEKEKAAKKWLNIKDTSNFNEREIQEINVIMEEKKDKEFERLQKHWDGLE